MDLPATDLSGGGGVGALVMSELRITQEQWDALVAERDQLLKDAVVMSGALSKLSFAVLAVPHGSLSASFVQRTLDDALAEGKP